MKLVSPKNFSEYIWTSLRSITNNFSNFTVQNLGNGYVKCFWEISRLDNLKIKFSQSYFVAIRLFDITNNRNKNNSTCIMKEIQVSKFQSAISFPVPINKGVYYFEFGYRKRNGEWRVIAQQNLNFGYRIQKIIQRLDKDNWFNTKNSIRSYQVGTHEEAYQLSLNTKVGGSENLSIEN